MTILAAVTDNPEGRASLQAAAREALAVGEQLLVVNLTGGELDTASLPQGLTIEQVEPPRNTLDEAENVLQILDSRSDITRLVIGVRRRSPIGKAIMGSIALRLIHDAQVPVLAVKAPPA